MVEAISGGPEEIQDSNEENEPNPDQLALESIGDQEQPPKKLAYNGPPRGTINLPPRNNHNFGHKPFLQKNKPSIFDGKNSYNGPPPPPPLPPKQAMDKYGTSGGGDIWPAPVPDMPKIISLDVKCEKNLMKVYIGFDKPFYGIVFSKGHYSNVHCVHLPAGLGRTSAHFEIGKNKYKLIYNM